MGFRTSRGSTSRGGMQALREMAGLLRRGGDCALTPDGPRGPAEKAKQGLAHISRLSQKPVVALGVSGWPRLRFRSWDGFMLPLPFARLVVVEGRPVGPPVRDGGAVAATAMLEAEMRRVTAFADYLASPSSRLASGLVMAAGSALAIPASIALLARPKLERMERRGTVQKRDDHPVVLHGSSLGEISGLIPLAEALIGEGVPVHLTCFTPAARLHLSRHDIPCSHIPLDCPAWVDRFFQNTRPRALVLAETEIWPNLITAALERSIPCVSVNSSLSERSLRRFRAFSGATAGRLLSCFCAILARTEDDARRLLRLGVSPDLVKFAGDSKSLCDCGDPPLEWRSYIPPGVRVLVAGSTREGEELPVARAAIAAGLFPVIAPRHTGRVASVESQLGGEGISTSRWSEGPAASQAKSCLIVDSHGLLSRLYGLADVAFVGGTLAPLGGHNILEPLRRGVPVVVGESFESIRAVVEEGRALGAVASASAAGLEAAFSKMLLDGPGPAVLLALGNSLGRNVLDAFMRAMDEAGVFARRGRA
jgi:3-deoxy-D-manno-octulosonic-acid transferase